MVIKGLLYSKEHEWVKKDGDAIILGITDHAQEMLGDITFIELPEPDSNIKQGGQIAVVESSKAASDWPVNVTNQKCSQGVCCRTGCPGR